jgi:cyanophycinase
MILPYRALSGTNSRRIRWMLYSVITAGLASVAVLGWNYWSYTHAATQPNAVTPTIRPNGGTLVISGGGGVPDSVRARFYELAGGQNARIVVIPTASIYADEPRIQATLDPWKKFNTASLQMLHTRNRELADDTEFVKPLCEATGVWIGGGRQKLLSEAYVGTEVERQLMALLDRGGVIGGTSAGAAIMTRVMIADGRGKAIMGTGFDFLQGAVVDQHFMKRNRVGRLLGVLEEHPDLIGFGIDERTALVVNVRDSRLRVIGDSYVFACVPDPTGHPARLEILKPGDEADVAGLKDMDKPIVSSIDLEAH